MVSDVTLAHSYARQSHETGSNRQWLDMLCRLGLFASSTSSVVCRWWFKLMRQTTTLRTITSISCLAWGTQSLLARVNWWRHVPGKNVHVAAHPSGSDNTTTFSLVWPRRNVGGVSHSRDVIVTSVHWSITLYYINVKKLLAKWHI